MRLISAALFILALIAFAHASHACPPSYVDCGRGVCCPQ
jgi:hypothetical protein